MYYIPSSVDIELKIDKVGLQHFLQEIAEICYSKSQHIEENFQDHSLAQLWESCGDDLWKFSTSRNINLLP